ncbi:hypothetical protein ACOTD9_30100, partial [Achromobacter xylosoxidans]
IGVDQLRAVHAAAGLHHEKRLKGRQTPRDISGLEGRSANVFPGQKSAAPQGKTYRGDRS